MPAYVLGMLTSSCHSKRSARSLWTALALVVPTVATACGSDTPPPPPAPLNLLAAGATEPSVRDEIGIFNTQSGLTVNFTFGSAGALRDMVLGGTPADVVVVTPAIITTLDAQQHVYPGSRVDLGRIGGGLAVKAGAPLPAISTTDELKQTLLDADEVYYADPALATAGAALMTIVDNLGIGDQVRAKGHTAPGGQAAIQNMTRSTAARAIGATQLSEILAVPEATLVGEYPAAVQVKTTYSAIIIAGTERLADAQKLVQFFLGPDFQTRLARSGFEPVPPPSN
jgi:molybdate transport system substrate-binding protein